MAVESRTAADWRDTNRVLDDDAFGEESDTGRQKMGDGVSPWNALDYYGETNARLVAVPATAGADGAVGDYAVASGFAYFCVATDTWQRVAIATW